MFEVGDLFIPPSSTWLRYPRHRIITNVGVKWVSYQFTIAESVYTHRMAIVTLCKRIENERWRHISRLLTLPHGL